MSLLPKTLLVRAYLLIAVLIAASLGASFAIFRHAEQEPHSRQLAQLVISVVNLTRAAMLSAAPEWRGALLAELADSEGLRVHIAEPDDLLEPLQAESGQMRMMVAKVRRQLGNSTRFASRRNGVEALWVSFYIGDDEFWVALPSERVSYPASRAWLVWGGVVALFSLLGAYFIARQVAMPLRRLVVAARQVGQGTTPEPLPEQGVKEVVAVSAAFNQMSADLATNERDRAVVLAGISHDLRTPLSRIRLAAEMSLDKSLREGLVADVEQMEEVIRQFLDYARLDETEAAVPVDMAALVKEVAERFVRSAQELTLEIQPVRKLYARPMLLKRAVANLIDNAIKHGGGHVAVHLEERAGKVILTVADRGRGIPLEQRDSVKRPFVRLEVARSDATGSGLGLAIVERAARLHEGDFQLDEAPGGGLAARLILPV
jgi:two-component system osmolarity sensor histidine kinase EnvZ